jgi:hypothetical protein
MNIIILHVNPMPGIDQGARNYKIAMLSIRYRNTHVSIGTRECSRTGKTVFHMVSCQSIKELQLW